MFATASGPCLHRVVPEHRHTWPGTVNMLSHGPVLLQSQTWFNRAMARFLLSPLLVRLAELVRIRCGRVDTHLAS